MKAEKRKKLEAAGWKFGSAAEFLQLTPEEEAYIECKMALSKSLRNLRERKNWSQTRLAEEIGSSQSRVAKMESGDHSVSMDLLVKSLLTIGASNNDLANAIAGKKLRA